MAALRRAELQHLCSAAGKSQPPAAALPPATELPAREGDPETRTHRAVINYLVEKLEETLTDRRRYFERYTTLREMVLTRSSLPCGNESSQRTAAEALAEMESKWVLSDQALLEARLLRARGRHRRLFEAVRRKESQVEEVLKCAEARRAADAAREELLQQLGALPAPAVWRWGEKEFQGDFTAPEVDMTGKTVVITGPSRGGIGFETALALARSGATVLLAARNIEKADSDAEVIMQQTGKDKPKVFKCDVSSVAQEILKDHAVIDVLINNAGAVFDDGGQAGPVEITFATCVLGHHLLNYMLKPSRIVWVTGDIYAISDGSANPHFNGKGISAYANACLARLMLARETKRRGLCSEIVAVHPGVIRSQFIKPKGCLEGAMLKSFDWGRITVTAGAQSSIYAATLPSSDLREDTIYYHNKYGWYVLHPNDLAMNATRCEALFDECDKLCEIVR
ncbi:unnamed protein product [Symbiodinium pilosum]|uniref:Uncharacterized protein n=1 Tax=Symbiodinium pilosum TaxID=2952 RepID=A0A812WJM2_SYMPI|nr:unnamed protein product [Symbiodinium pilosum]